MVAWCNGRDAVHKLALPIRSADQQCQLVQEPRWKHECSSMEQVSCEGWARENLAEAGSGESNVACSEPAFEVALVLRILRRCWEVESVTDLVGATHPSGPLIFLTSLK